MQRRGHPRTAEQAGHGSLPAIRPSKGGRDEDDDARLRLPAVAMCLAVALGAGTANGSEDVTDCCYPGSVIYYDEAGTVVGVRMYGCGDPGWGIVTRRARAVNGCVM